MSRREGEDRGVWRVGELARLTGLSVRTLHYYDEIGLVSPARRGEERGGYRLYSAEDVLRLQQVRSLRALGFGLREIRGCLEDGLSVRRVIELHASGLKEQIRLRQELLRRLEAVEERLRPAGEVPAGELVNAAMEVVEVTERIEKYYSPEQLEYLERRRREVGDERIREVEAEWPRLMEQVRAEMEAGTDPSDERVQEFARRWRELIEEFTGGDPGVARSLGNVWQQEENVHGIDTAETREMMEYISRANTTRE